jgi:hypothetical protein
MSIKDNSVNKWYEFKTPYSISLVNRRIQKGVSSGNLIYYKSSKKRKGFPVEAFLFGDNSIANYILKRPLHNDVEDDGVLKEYKKLIPEVYDYEMLKRYDNQLGYIDNYILYSDKKINYQNGDINFYNLSNNSIREDVTAKLNLLGMVSDDDQKLIINLGKYINIIQYFVRDNNLINIINPMDYFKYLDDLNKNKKLGFGFIIFKKHNHNLFDCNLQLLNNLSKSEQSEVIYEELKLLIKTDINIIDVEHFDSSETLLNFSFKYLDNNQRNSLWNELSSLETDDFKLLENLIKLNDITKVNDILPNFKLNNSYKKTVLSQNLADIVSSAEMAKILCENKFDSAKSLLKESPIQNVALMALSYHQSLKCSDIVRMINLGNLDICITLLKTEKLLLSNLCNDSEDLFKLLLDKKNKAERYSFRDIKKFVSNLKVLGIKQPSIDVVIYMFKESSEAEFKYVLKTFQYTDDDYNKLFKNINASNKIDATVRKFLNVLSEVNYNQDLKELIVSVDKSTIGHGFPWLPELFSKFLKKVNKNQDLNDFCGLADNLILTLTKNSHRYYIHDLLKKYNISLNVETNNIYGLLTYVPNCTPLHYAIRNNNYDYDIKLIEEFLENKTCKVTEKILRMSIIQKNIGTSILLLNNELNINYLTENGDNFLHALCGVIKNINYSLVTLNTVEKLMDLLIDKGLNVNAKNNFGKTPLDILMEKELVAVEKNIEEYEYMKSKLLFKILNNNLINSSTPIVSKSKI